MAVRQASSPPGQPSRRRRSKKLNSTTPDTRSPSPPPEAWKGLWIWYPGVEPGGKPNDYCFLRRTFNLASPPVSAHVIVTAIDRYRLFVNGKPVCRGPARCQPWRPAYDELDLAPYLKQGRNCLAVQALRFGVSTFQSIDRDVFGFLLDGVVTCRSGEPVPIHTDNRWKAKPNEAYRRMTARYTIQLGFQEDVSGDALPERWTQVNFRDASWPDAQSYASALTVPHESFEPRGIPFSRESPARFVRIVGEFTGRHGPEYARARDIGRLVADETYRPVKRSGITRPESMLKGRDPAVVRPLDKARFHAVVLDAGKETAGYVNLDVDAAGGEIIDFFHTEHVRSDGSPVRRARNGALASMGDRYRCGKGRQRFQFYSWKGFRYLVVVFRNVRRPLKVHRIDYTFTSYPVEKRGGFQCSDARLNRIWEVGAWTQQLCMHDAYMDCPWREQAQWWGDARIQWRVNMAVFGDHALFKRGIRQIGQSQAYHGLTYGIYPCAAHALILPDYTLTWICSIWDYYFYSGDDEPIHEHFERIIKALAWFEKHAGKACLLGNAPVGMWLFLDWAPLFKAGYSCTFTMQYLEALQTAARMAEHVKRPREAKRWGTQANRVRRAIIDTFWDDRGKRFIEGRYTDGRAYDQVAQHGNTYAILTGILPKAHRHLADCIVDISRRFDELKADNVGGNWQHPRAKFPIASSFFFAYVLEAMFRQGRHADALWAIHKLWGEMLDDGATTWYESWDHCEQTHGNTSACHAWSASPTYHLSENIGGIRPVSPGFDEIMIAPRPTGVREARVIYPTRYGEVGVEWSSRKQGGGDLEIKVPDGISATVSLAEGEAKKVGQGRHSFRTG